MKLTDNAVRALHLPRGVPDKVWFDDELGGFGVRMRDGGARSWIVQYDFGGKAHKMTLGAVDTLSAARARASAKDILAAVRLGRNPAAEKRRARVQTAETFSARCCPVISPISAPSSSRALSKKSSATC
jgi:hypothetical protein